MDFDAHTLHYTGARMDASAVLRPYEDGDYIQYQRMYNEAFAPMRRALDIAPVYCCESRVAIQEKKEHIYVLEEEGRLIASVSLYGGEIDDLIVDRSQRGRGVGTQVLRFAVNLLQTKGVRPITLHVADWNQSALRMYLKNGFVITHTETIHR